MKKITTLVGLLVMSTGPVSAEGNWIADPITGCELWDTDADPANDVVSWSGDCFRGRADGDGVLSVFHDGGLIARFEGEMRDGRPHGDGKLAYASDDGFILIDGLWVEGRPEGAATVQWPSGDRMIGTLSGSVGTGSGVFMDSDGGRLAGSWEDGRIIGKTSYESADGDLFTGTFKDDLPERGVLIYANGTRYEGSFENGEPQGEGELSWTNGASYKGSIAAGEPEGLGTLVWPNGSVMAGSFKNGRPDGEMLVTSRDGAETVEVWANGEKVQ